MTQNKLHTRIASAFLFVLACVTSTIAADKLSIGYLSSTGQGKFFIAKDAGIFKKNGLDVELVEFSNSGDGIAAVRAALFTFFTEGRPEDIGLEQNCKYTAGQSNPEDNGSVNGDSQGDGQEYS